MKAVQRVDEPSLENLSGEEEWKEQGDSFSQEDSEEDDRLSAGGDVSGKRDSMIPILFPMKKENRDHIVVIIVDGILDSEEGKKKVISEPRLLASSSEPEGEVSTPRCLNPSAQDPSANEGEVSTPGCLKPSAQDPSANEGEVSTPGCLKPSAQDPSANEGEVSTPGCLKPSAQDPSANEGEVSTPGCLKPSAQDPSANEGEVSTPG